MLTERLDDDYSGTKTLSFFCQKKLSKCETMNIRRLIGVIYYGSVSSC